DLGEVVAHHHARGAARGADGVAERHQVGQAGGLGDVAAVGGRSLGADGGVGVAIGVERAVAEQRRKREVVRLGGLGGVDLEVGGLDEGGLGVVVFGEVEQRG